nr:DUF4116 domain-containing protein [Desulfovibrio sp.]
YVPMELRTRELCLAAVKADGMAIRDVPERLKTPEICLAAVQDAGVWALAEVPEAMRTAEICEAATASGLLMETVCDEE